MKNNELGIRMKKYEYISRIHLIPRMPVIIRLDGKDFHTFTRKFVRPFDRLLSESMQETMKYLCENIQGCVLGYTQSDEITLVLVDYQKIDSSSWYDYNTQKICSVSASMATMAFNRIFSEKKNKCISQNKNMFEVYDNAIRKGVMFDSRVFNIPKDEVANYIFWRQQDATRNSIQMVGQANFSHKQLQNKSCSKIQDMLMLKKGINWNNTPTRFKRGSCCIRKYVSISNESGCFQRKKWVIDNEILIFKGEGREYIEELVYISNNKSEKLLTI